jgi:hypothetical protein
MNQGPEQAVGFFWVFVCLFVCLFLLSPFVLSFLHLLTCVYIVPLPATHTPNQQWVLTAPSDDSDAL